MSGATRAARRLAPPEVAALRAMARDEWTLTRMAARLGVSRRVIEREAVVHGVALPGKRPPGARVDAVAAMLGDAALCERVRRMRADERRSYDFIGGREAMPADHIRLLGDALGLPCGHLNRGRTSGHAARCAGPAGAAP